jgi:hypothetical protein
MLFAIAKGCTNNLLRFFIYNYLALKSVSFLLTGVKMFLPVIAILYSFFLSDFFLGRSIGLSFASIRITSYSISLLSSSFFPGSENAPLLINTSSTHLQVR